MSDNDKTIPMAECEGDPGCKNEIAVMLFKTGEKLCAYCGIDRLVPITMGAPPVIREVSDTDKAPPMPNSEE